MFVVSFRWTQGRGWSLGTPDTDSVQSLSLRCALDSMDRGCCTVPFVGLGFFASLKQEVFPLRLGWRLYWKSSWQLTVFFFLEQFSAWLVFLFSPSEETSRTILNPRLQSSWTNMRKDIKFTTPLWLLWGGDLHQKSNRFPTCSAPGCYVNSSSPSQISHYFVFQAMLSAHVFFFPGYFLSVFLFCCGWVYGGVFVGVGEASRSSYLAFIPAFSVPCRQPHPPPPQYFFC